MAAFSPPPLPAPLARLAARCTVHVRHFLLALGFLTRLAPPLAADKADMGRSVLYYPLVGALLGALLCLPPTLGLFAAYPALQAWVYLLLSVWLTRALHLDGLADVLDALGSGLQGQGFQTVLKDSRIGAFGVVGLVLALGGQAILLTPLLESGNLAPLFFAPLYARCLPIVFASLARPHPQASLGSILATAPRKTALIIALLTALVSGPLCLSPARFCLCLLLTLPFLSLLLRLARREGGYNGDFLGCCIITGELAALLSALP